MSKTLDIAITPEQSQIVAAILQKHIPNTTVWAFGSRAKHRAKPFSDLDLATIGETLMPLNLLGGDGGRFHRISIAV